MRAIWHALPDWALNPKDFLKQEWKVGFKDKLYAMIQSEAEGSLPDNLVRNPVYQVSFVFDSPSESNRL